MVLDVARRRLGLDLDPATSFNHLPLAAKRPNTSHPNWNTRLALLVYAVYRTTNAARHNPLHSTEMARRAIQESIYEGAKGHRGATEAADHWTRPVNQQ